MAGERIPDRIEDGVQRIGRLGGGRIHQCPTCVAIRLLHARALAADPQDLVGAEPDGHQLDP